MDASQQVLLTKMLLRYKQLAKELYAPNDLAGEVEREIKDSSTTGKPAPSPAACAAMEAAGGWWVPWGQ
jgi:hypothetical protein